MTAAAEVQAHARELRSQLDALQSRVTATLSHADDVLRQRDAAVTLTFDEEGFLADIAVDPLLRRRLSAEQLARQIDDALQTTARRSPLASAPVVATQGSGPVTSEEKTALLDASRCATAALATESEAELVSTSGEAGVVTVTVRARTGDLIGVRCDPRWLASTPDDLAFDVIVTTARAAARAALEKGRR